MIFLMNAPIGARARSAAAVPMGAASLIRDVRARTAEAV